jgi:deoxycytidylate deaminase
MSDRFDWSDLAFASKKPLNELNATFIAAPRELSQARFRQLIKQYLPQGNIILGLAKEPYVLGLEEQPAFRMLTPSAVQLTIDKVNSASAHTLTILSYFQRDLPFIIEKLDIKKAVFINGSWYHAFHLRPEYYALTKRQINYELVTPFADEAEAKSYAANLTASAIPKSGEFTEQEMMALASRAGEQSLASSEHQTGVALGRKRGSKYELITTSFNRVVPYQTYAMHNGSIRERNFSPMNDLNYYDANHAEVELITAAAHDRINLEGTTLFINLLPCPTCARMFTSTEIAEFTYAQDHSDGYAVRMLERAGKTVRRFV